MKVYKYFPKDFSCNSYLVTADNKSAVVIDCGSPELFNFCQNLGLTPVAVLLTHGHFDHVGGCSVFGGSGVPIYCGEKEKELIFSEPYLGIFGGVDVSDFNISGTFKDGERVTFGGIEFTVIETAGHTAGGVCYLAEDCLFAGDTLFRGSVGRTDLPTGNFAELTASLKKLYALDGDFKVYCGHGEETTLDYERSYNPYMRR